MLKLHFCPQVPTSCTSTRMEDLRPLSENSTLWIVELWPDVIISPKPTAVTCVCCLIPARNRCLLSIARLPRSRLTPTLPRAMASIAPEECLLSPIPAAIPRSPKGGTPATRPTGKEALLPSPPLDSEVINTKMIV